MMLRPMPGSWKSRRSQHVSGRRARRPAGVRGARQFRPGTRSCSVTPGSRTDRALLARLARRGRVTAGTSRAPAGSAGQRAAASFGSSAAPAVPAALACAGRCRSRRRQADRKGTMSINRLIASAGHGGAGVAEHPSGRPGRGRLRAEHGGVQPAWWRRTRRITRRAGCRRTAANSGSGLGLV